jgi:hypothetical protein
MPPVRSPHVSDFGASVCEESVRDMRNFTHREYSTRVTGRSPEGAPALSPTKQHHNKRDDEHDQGYAEQCDFH